MEKKFKDTDFCRLKLEFSADYAWMFFPKKKGEVLITDIPYSDMISKYGMYNLSLKEN